MIGHESGLRRRKSKGKSAFSKYGAPIIQEQIQKYIDLRKDENS